MARLLAEYATRLRRPFAAFDTNPGAADLASRFPDETTIAELDATNQQWLFDCLTARDGKTKILDLAVPVWDLFFAMCRDGDFLRVGGERAIDPIVVLVVDDSRQCHDACDALLRDWPGANLAVACDAGATGLHRMDDVLASYPINRNFEIEALGATAAARLRDHPGSLVTALEADEDAIRDSRAELSRWLSAVFAQIRSFELRMALSSSAFLR